VTAQRTNTKKRRLPPGKATLKALTEAAIVDAYDESKQRTGFYTMLDEYLGRPFDSEILGLPACAASLAAGDFHLRRPAPGSSADGGRHSASERAGV
jgi:hypothetical protein